MKRCCLCIFGGKGIEMVVVRSWHSFLEDGLVPADDLDGFVVSIPLCGLFYGRILAGSITTC
jgi:hypothetical protein